MSTGYNGVAAGTVHCTAKPCRGAKHKSGVGLDDCEAIHAEQNAIAYCPDVKRIFTIYSTLSPCISCVKLCLTTSASRIVFRDNYCHASAKLLWEAAGKKWIHLPHQQDLPQTDIEQYISRQRGEQQP